MQGICINNESSSNLVAGQQYYLFEHSKTHYYASKFDTPRSFFGIYRKSLFDVPVAQKQLTQAEIWSAWKAANDKFNRLIEARDYNTSNKFRHEVMALFEQLDNPFEVGDVVEYRSGRKWARTVITEIRSNSRVLTKDYIAPFTSFRFPMEEKVEREPEQLSLF